MAIMSFEEFSQGKPVKRLGIPAAPQPAQAPSKPGFLSNVATDFRERVNAAADSQIADQGTGSKILQTLGQGAGFIGDIGFDALKAATPEPVKEVASSAAQAVASTEPVQDITSLVSAWSQAHPEASKNLQAIVNIASLVPAVKGAGVVEDLAKTGVNKAVTGVKDVVDETGKIIAGAGRKSINPVEDALQLTSPVLNKKGSIAAFEKSGKPGGVATKPGILQNIEYVPTKYDEEVAKTASPFVSASKNPAQNNYALGREIERFSTDEVKPYLEANPRAVNTKTVEARLKAVPTPDLFKTEPVLERSYNLVRQKMINRVKESGGNTLDLWNARKKFDEDVIKEFGDVAFDDAKYTPINRAISDMRKEMNSLIADQIGDRTFTDQMKRLSNLYEARTRIAEKNYKLLSSNRFSRWAAENPVKANLIKFGIPGSVSLLTGATLLGK